MKTILVSLAVLASFLGAFWLWAGRAAYRQAWPAPAPTAASEPLSRVVHAMEDEFTVRSHLLYLTSRQLRAHITPSRLRQDEMLLFAYVRYWLPSDEAYARFLASTYFGDQTSGVAQAAENLWHTSPEKLSAAQSVELMLRSRYPTRPVTPEARASALRDLVGRGVISADEAGL